MAIFCSQRNEKVPYLTCMGCDDRIKCQKNGTLKTKKEDALDELRDLVEKLRQSEQNYTKEELLSKFGKVYHGLQEKIKEFMVTCLQESFFSIMYETTFSEKEIAALQKIADDSMAILSKVIYQYKDVDLFKQILDQQAQLFQEVESEFYSIRIKRQ